MKQKIKEWEKLTNEIAESFTDNYYPECSETWWRGGEVGGTFFINDDFWSFEEIKRALEFEVDSDILSGYQDAIANGEEINFKNFMAKSYYSVEWSEADRKYVAKCKEFPKLIYSDKSAGKALRGIEELVEGIKKNENDK